MCACTVPTGKVCGKFLCFWSTWEFGGVEQAKTFSYMRRLFLVSLVGELHCATEQEISPKNLHCFLKNWYVALFLSKTKAGNLLNSLLNNEKFTFSDY